MASPQIKGHRLQFPRILLAGILTLDMKAQESKQHQNPKF